MKKEGIDLKQLRKDLEVDEHNLQFEWVNQPNLFMSYAIELSKFIKKRDLKRKELSESITKEEEKISEAKLNRLLEADEEIIELSYQVHQHKYAIQAFEMKKKSLEHEQGLLIGGFFSEPVRKKGK